MRTKTDSQNLREAEARLDRALGDLLAARQEVEEAVAECRASHMPIRRLADQIGASKTTVHRGRWRFDVNLTRTT